MADQLQTARRHRDNSRECSCSFTTQLSTTQLLNNFPMRFACRNAINVLRVHQGIRTHRAPTEGSQDKGSCVRPPRFDRRTGKFSSDEVCAGVPTHRSMHSLARCCNRWQPESALSEQLTCLPRPEGVCAIQASVPTNLLPRRLRLQRE